MNNRYEVKGDKACIFLTHKDGRQEVVTIDAQDLHIAQEFKGHWYPFRHPRTGKIYARGYYRDPKTKKVQQPLLHRLIMNPTRGQNTGHIDGDTLNCTRGNMINVPIGVNIKDVIKKTPIECKSCEEAQACDYQIVDICTQQGKNELEILSTIEPKALVNVLNNLKEAGSIEKGVSFHKTKRRWEVSAYHEGKRYRLGYWDPGELQQANEAVLFFRANGPEAFNHKYKRG